MTGSKFSNMTLLLPNDQIHRTSDVLDSLWLPTSSSHFNGSSSMVSFEKASGAEMGQFFDDDECDGSLLRPGKKRRLSGEQVQFLEKSFDVDNKLEPERKVQIAKELGLQPRQVAIWFQNRKARYKSKQLEKDYDVLRSSFDKMQSDFDDLVKEKEILEQQVMFLKEKLLKRGNPETGLFTAQELQLLHEHVPKTLSENGSDPDSVVAPTMLVCKQEDASSAKSDVLDSDSAHYTPHSNSLLEPTTADSSNVFESDEDDDNFTRSFLPAAPPVPSYLSKLEDGLFQHSNGGSATSCNFGFQNEDHELFCFWP